MTEVTLEPPPPDTSDQEVASMERTLNRQTDRCDRCGSEAYARTVMAGGGELLWCGHHFSKHEDVLRQQALFVQDERSKINPTPSVAAY